MCVGYKTRGPAPQITPTMCSPEPVMETNSGEMRSLVVDKWTVHFQYRNSSSVSVALTKGLKSKPDGCAVQSTTALIFWVCEVQTSGIKLAWSGAHLTPRCNNRPNTSSRRHAPFCHPHIVRACVFVIYIYISKELFLTADTHASCV